MSEWEVGTPTFYTWRNYVRNYQLIHHACIVSRDDYTYILYNLCLQSIFQQPWDIRRYFRITKSSNRYLRYRNIGIPRQLIIYEDNHNGYVIVKWSSIPLPHLDKIGVFNFGNFDEFQQGCYNQSFGYPLSNANVKYQNKHKLWAKNCIHIVMPTGLGFRCTISTAAWFVRCSHNPSDANMKNLSWWLKTLVDIDGSALRIGLLRRPGSWNFPNFESTANSCFFIYPSPIALEIWKPWRIQKKKKIKFKNKTGNYSYF